MAIAENDPEGQARLSTFKKLQELGWNDGVNIRVDVRWATPKDRNLRERYARELVALYPDLLLSHATPSTASLAARTHTIPTVFVGVSDPIGSGFVASFTRPGGNVTGFITMEPTMAGKWLELLSEIAPRVKRASFVFNPVTVPYAEYYFRPFEDAAKSLSVETIATPVRSVTELEAVIAAVARANAGLIVIPDTFMNSHRKEVVSLAPRYNLPAIYAFRFFTEAGGLLSYGVDLVEQYKGAARYADRILRGAQASDLPVQAPSKFELVINIKVAKALGLRVPARLLARADRVIE
jgi:putative ABC transport system substrate-binding protein